MAKLNKSVENNIRKKFDEWVRTTGKDDKRINNRTVKLFFEEMPTDIDAKTIPYYYPDSNGNPTNTTFNITFNIAFLNANKNNLQSDGVVGGIVHELVHCLHFLKNMKEYNSKPHTASFFKNNLKKYMKIAGDGIHDYDDGYRPDLRIDAAITMRRNAVAPNWLDRYWVYMCKDCGFTNSFISDMRTKSPNKCEKCGSKNILKVLVSPEQAARFELNTAVQKSGLSKAERDKIIVKMLLNYLRKSLRGKDLSDFKNAISTWYKNGNYIKKPKSAVLSGGLISAKSTCRKGRRKRIDTIKVNRFV